MTATAFQFWQACLNLIWIFGCAGAGMPLLIITSLIFGRRGNAAFCIAGARRLATLACIFASFGFLYLAGDFIVQILSVSQPGHSTWNAFFQPAGLPHATALAAWTAGFICLATAKTSLPPAPASERYALAYIKLPILFYLAAAAFFLASFFLINWPFAGLPEHLTLERAVMAIARNAMRHYFVTFSLAGALALPFAFRALANAAELKTNAIRWLSVWGIAGYLPSTISRWGLMLGTGFLASSRGVNLPGYHAQLFSLACVTGAMLCWVLLLMARFQKPLFAWLALGFVFLSSLGPVLLRLLNI